MGCSNEKPTVLFSDSINANSVINESGNIHFTGEPSFDSDGSCMLSADTSAVFSLFTVHNIDVENTAIVYSAMVKTENLKGRCYLEMWCFFPDKGRYFSRGLDNALTGNNDWTKITTPFFLKEGENPDSIHLNIVTQGSGTVYIDNITLQHTDN
ncbi:MAG: hypothetical protein R6U31_02095 [bacterium]